MSRNFDLLMEIQNEASAPGVRKAFISAPEPAANVPDSSVNQTEILHLVERIFFDTSKTTPRRVVFCAIEPNKESSDICAAVGRALAASKSGRVCVVSANLRSARLAQLFEVAAGSLDVGKPLTGVEACSQVAPNLWFAKADYLPNEAGNLKSGTALEMCLRALRNAFDYILIEAPPFSVSQESLMLGRFADAAVLVVKANKTRREAARQAMLALNAEGIPILGTVMTAASK